MSNYSWISEKIKKKSIYFSQYELAWKISDANEFIEDALKNEVIVLGGDILDSNMNYTCDNWYYEPDKSIERKVNSIQSCSCMKEYIDNYVKLNGTDYYIVIVCVTIF